MTLQRKSVYEAIWKIENITPWLQARDDTLYSPVFRAETLRSTQWKLKLSQCWQLGDKYISLTLQRNFEDDHPEPINLNYELLFLSSEGSPLKSKICSKKFSPKTVGQELNVREFEILRERKKFYVPEGDLTVCCKFWYAWSTVLKGKQCSMRTVIGTKRMYLKATIDNISLPLKVPVHFLPPSTNISKITLDVQVSDSEFLFQPTNVECKNFSWCTYKLYALDKWGRKTEFDEIVPDLKYMTANSSEKLKNLSFNAFWHHYIPNNTLTVLLLIMCNPDVASESTTIGELNTSEELTIADMLGNLRNALCNLNPLDPSNVPESESSDDESDDATEKRYLPSTTLKSDLTSLYNNHLFCDTKLQTDTETFPAHRNILSARSPVFNKMFTTDMKEAAGECIRIPDISADTIRQMLQFIYTDTTDDLEMQSARDLYIASDKYDIASLKQRCLTFMKENLCPNNVCQVLVIADMHQDKDLECVAHEFILKHDKEIFGSNEWKSFMKKFGTLAAQVMFLKCMKE